MTTLVCRVQQRLPVSIVSVFGTIDMDTVPRLMVTLRDCVADGPSALLVDVEHAVVGADRALVPLVCLCEDVRMWPGASVSLCGASPATSAAVWRVAETAGEGEGARAGVAAELLRYPTVAAALAAAEETADRLRREVRLRPERVAPALARAVTRAACRDWGMARLAPVAEFVVSELVTNAVVHARTPMQLMLGRREGIFSVAVRDGDPRPMSRPQALPRGSDEEPAEKGRGLLMLDAMADAWGCLPSADGKVVWATIGVPGSSNGLTPSQDQPLL